MNCPRCGEPLLPRPRARFYLTGAILVLAALLLLAFVRLPVVVLAAVLMAVTGASMLRGAAKATPRCPRCRR